MADVGRNSETAGDGRRLWRTLRTLLSRCGVDPRGWIALTRALLLMDLREQHFARATASKPHYVLSPLFLVVGQMLTASVLTCGFLFARVDVRFFVFVNVTVSFLLLTSALIVELHEIAFHPADLEVIGHRPVTPRTYACARLANLLFYFLLLFVALNIFPLLLGSALRDAGPWYAPAYLVVSLTGSLCILALTVLSLTLVDANRLYGVKQVLSWVQILAIMIVFYGGQLMLRDGAARLQVWGAFPPIWCTYLPTDWLARLVERASCEPELYLLAPFVLCGLVGIGSLGATVAWMTWLARRMQPLERTGGTNRPMSRSLLGGLAGKGAGWFTRSPEGRVGFWLGVTFLLRDPGLTIRCLFTFQIALAAAIVGAIGGQFGNPCQDNDSFITTLPLLAFFGVPLGAPALVYNLTYCRDSEGGWLLRTAMVCDPFALAWGPCKAVLLGVVTPLCIFMGVLAAILWQDGVSAVLHASLALALTWLSLRVSLWLVAPAWPLSLPQPRGAGLTLPVGPMVIFGLTLSTLGAMHIWLAPTRVYWIVIFLLIPILGRIFQRLAGQHLTRLGAPVS